MDNLLDDALKKITRRLDTLEQKVDTQNNDRNILEDILTRLTSLENAVHMNREHQTEVQKDIRADIKQSQFATEDKVNEINRRMTDQTILVKSLSTNIFRRIFSKLKGRR